MLVDADRQDAGVVPERGLDAVAVMDVNVEVGDAAGAVVEQPGDGDGGVVVDAEAAGIAAHRVVQAAGNVGAVLGRAGPDGPGGCERGAGDEGGCVVHAGEDGVVCGAQAVGEQGGGVRHAADALETGALETGAVETGGQPAPSAPGPVQAGRCGAARSLCPLAGCPGAGLPDDLDIGGIVDELQLGVRGRIHWRDRYPVGGQQAERAGQFDRELDPDRGHRVVGAEVVAGQPLVPGHLQGTGHVVVPFRERAADTTAR